VSGHRARPYESILAATPKNVRLVLEGGRVLYGDAGLRPLGQTTPECDALDVCDTSKFACVAQAGGAATDRLGDSFAVIKNRLVSEFCRGTTTGI